MNQQSDFLSAREAAAWLGVRLPTLYAYVSRGLVGSVPAERGRARRYARSDLVRLKARSDARAGHTAVAAGALHWGEPVLESSITAIRGDGPAYRGHSAVALARADVPFESVATLLWTGSLPESPPVFDAGGLELPSKIHESLRESSFVERLACAVPLLALGDRTCFGASEASELERARSLIRCLVAALALGGEARDARRALERTTIAEAALYALGSAATATERRAVNRILVLSADHELNVSAFAARVVASSGADLYASLSAAIAAFSGPRHGAASDRVAALVDQVGAPKNARRVIEDRARRGEAIAGFGHPLYPGGDPRAAPLFDAARAMRSSSRELATLIAIVRAMARAGQPPPNVDAGLCALTYALGLPRGAPSALFAIGRSAGWIAHALEQRRSGELLRPRAKYVGPTG